MLLLLQKLQCVSPFKEGHRPIHHHHLYPMWHLITILFFFDVVIVATIIVTGVTRLSSRQTLLGRLLYLSRTRNQDFIQTWKFWHIFKKGGAATFFSKIFVGLAYFKLFMEFLTEPLRTGLCPLLFNFIAKLHLRISSWLSRGALFLFSLVLSNFWEEDENILFSSTYRAVVLSSSLRIAIKSLARTSRLQPWKGATICNFHI